MERATCSGRPTPETPQFERILGSYTTGEAGPTVVVTAGIHGNEPAGAFALRRFFDTLEEKQLPLRGKVIGLTGNIPALARNARFLSRDLNRGWSSKKARELLKSPDTALDAEDREQRELLAILFGIFAEAREPVVFIDLHSTSATGAPFCAIADTLRNRRIAFALPVPVILGLEETIDGTMLSYLDGLGHISLVFEGGQHNAPDTIDHHEAAVWISLVAAGALESDVIPRYDELSERLASSAHGVPHVLEIRHCHAVHPEDDFRMRPGYVNFQSIRAGEVLADDVRGEIRANSNSRILMPLYQKQGEDGFFVVHQVLRLWLIISRLIRLLRLDVALTLMPGVRHHPDRLDALLVDSRVARYLVIQVFHLFGFRRSGEENGKLLFTRRRPDFRRIKTPSLDDSNA